MAEQVEQFSLASVQEAKQFIKSLPSWVPKAAPVIEPEGDIGFHWRFGVDRVVTVSFDGKGLITYAAILGSKDRTQYGVTRRYKEVVDIMTSLQQVDGESNG